jgi:hypothetical protein
MEGPIRFRTKKHEGDKRVKPSLVPEINRRQFLSRAAGAAGVIAVEAAILKVWPKAAFAAAYDPILEGAIIRRPWDGCCWWIRNGYRHWIRNGTTYMAIYIDNGHRSYNWSDAQINAIPEREEAQDRIPAGQRAANWALAMVFRNIDQGWCLRFCAESYNAPAAGLNTAYEAWQAWGRWSPIPRGNELLPGMVLYFDRNDSNGREGHAGIYVGGGYFVSATASQVEQRTVLDWDNNIAKYLGYSEGPMPRWPGF